MRRTAFVTAACVALGIATAAPAAAADADPMVTLPLSTFADLLVDDDHVYVTGGGSGGVVVRTRAGAAVTTVTGQPGASGLALSADGATLYVALRQGDAISAIDTTTLTERARYATGAGTCPRTLVADGPRVWFGHGCGSSGGLGVVDLSGETPVVKTAVVTGFNGPPLLDLANARLVTADSESAATIRTYDRDGTTLTAGPTRWLVGGNARDLDVSDDAQHVLVTTYDQTRYRVSDLSSDGVYPSNDGYPNAARAFGGYVTTGSDARYAPDVRVHHADGRLIRAYELGQTLVRGGLAYGADGTLYAVSGDTSFAEPLRLHVLADPAQPVTLVTLEAAEARIDQPLTVHGRLTSSAPIPPGRDVAIRRTGPDGAVTDLGTVPTTAYDRFTVTDTVGIRGTHTYTATFAGDAEHPPGSGSVPVLVVGLMPKLSITSDLARYPYRATAKVTATIASPTTNRFLRIYALPYASPEVVLPSVEVDASGQTTVTYVVTRRTTFTAWFAGDDRYEPLHAWRPITVRAALSQSLLGHYGRSGAYHLFRTATKPTLRALVRPDNAGTCQRFEVQRYDAAQWRPVATKECVRLDADSRATWMYGGVPRVGARYRMRSAFTGNYRNDPATGAWRYLTFTG